MIVRNRIPDLIVSLQVFKEEALREAAYFLKDKMKDTIRKQTESSWPALSPITLMKKFPETRKLYEKGFLVEAIKAKIAPLEATIGIHSEENRWEIGFWQEFGAPRAGIPARSFVRSTWARYQMEVKARIEGIFVRKTKIGK